MLLLFISFFITFAAASGPLKIVNGSNATIGEFPYAVSVRYNDCHHCGGSIISDRWVLTAAHCVHNDFLGVASILYGTIYVYNCQKLTHNIKRVKTAIINPDYEDYGAHWNDIALIEVDSPFEIDRRIAPVALPKQFQDIPRNRESTLVGWGYSVTDGEVMPILQKVNIVVFPDDVCESFFGVNMSAIANMCAGVPGGGRGQCSGDSGSALTIDGTIFGIVSWSDKPCATTPGVMTRVPSYRNWISSVTGI